MLDTSLPHVASLPHGEGSSEGDRHFYQALFLFAVFFSLYVLTASPYLAPYRDAGEMATSAATLGVSHPPSYPLYVLLGKLSQALPFGGPAFRLTLLSAAAAAGAVAALHLLLAPLFGPWAAALAAAWLGADKTFWSVAIVQEMYALSVLQAVVLLGLALRLRREYDPRLWRGFLFLYGLFLGNRTDLLLLSPALGWLVFSAGGWKAREGGVPVWALRSVPWAALGLSVYLYLPLRSSAGPWLDWNHPAELHNFIGSLTRRSYGGTLDLLSRNYATGAMFGENLKAYGRHVWDGFLGLGAWLPLAGLGYWWRRDRGAAIGLALAYLAAGPLFLFLANLPPNPHALAIVDPHYLLSDLIVAVLAAAGAAWVWEAASAWAGERRALAPRADASALAGAALLAAGFLPFWRTWDVGRRWDLMNYDYARNVLASVPPDRALVAKKDVPLFTLWYAQQVEGVRRDVRVVPQGLAGSPWYQLSSRRRGDLVQLGPLRSLEDWRSFGRTNEGAFATFDCEFPDGLLFGPPRGLALSLSTGTALDARPWGLIARRGDYRSDGQPDFFHTDLVDLYAFARHRVGVWQSEHGDKAEAERNIKAAWAMKWHLPDAPIFLGFAWFTASRLAEAAAAYTAAAGLFERTLRLAGEYHSLPDIWSGARRGLADARLNLGVVYEKLGRKDDAAREYQAAIQADPRSAQAYFNLAVVYWDRDWAKVAWAMSEALRIDPSRQDAAKYLAIARARLSGSGPPAPPGRPPRAP